MGHAPGIFDWVDATPPTTYRWGPDQPTAEGGLCGSLLNEFMYNRQCSLVLPALCGAPSSCAAEQVVTVSLPAIAGSVTPRNAASVGTTVLAFRPPVVTIAALGGNPTPSNRLDFAVNFSVPVSGFAASDCVVTSEGAAVVSRVLSGSSNAYVLSLDVQPPTQRACPVGFTASMDLPGHPLYCARVVTPNSKWANMERACGPYSLTTVISAAHNTFVRQVANAAGVGDTWYVGDEPSVVPLQS